MDLSMIVVETILTKFTADKKWFIQTIEQINEDDINWVPAEGSNSIANLVSHIRGTAHARLEILLLNIPDTRNREEEFNHTLYLTKEQALDLGVESFDIILRYLERLKLQPEQLLSQPYLDLPVLTHSALDNQTTAINMMIQLVREINYHIGQIIYIAKMRKGQLTWI